MQRSRTLAALVASAALLPFAASAQESAELDRIEVTGSRISYRDLLDTPAISITKRGDYLSQTITLVNDTRDEAGRQREIHGNIEKRIARAGDSHCIVLCRANLQSD